MRGGVVATLLLLGAAAVAPTAQPDDTRGPTLATAASTGAPSLTGALTPPRSPRNANYAITARLDPATRMLTASERITWQNMTRSPSSELHFHLYWNAWRDARSTFLRERSLVRTVRTRDDDLARLDITSITYRPEVSGVAPTEGQTTASTVDLRPTMRFIAPDDGNADDRTVMTVSLPQPVEPGGRITVDVAWTARVPRPFARTGVIGRFYFMAQWFPKLGVLEEGGWNCHQFHAATEFFSDYGVYDVTLTVPSEWTVGATGVERERRANADATTSHRYYQEDVHDFAWTTSPLFVERRATFEPTPGSRPGQRPVALRLLVLPEHTGQADRHLAAAAAALKHFSTWFGVYPYEQLTIVDPAYKSEADGMEYPTLITAGTSWLVPDTLTFSTPEEVVMHETGHQFFYGVVGTNEFEDAWMDEGINTYATARAMIEEYRTSYDERRYFGDVLPFVFRDLVLPRETVWNRLPGYRRTPVTDRPSDPSFRYHPATGRTVTYNKTALWMNTLERHLGWPTVRRILATYYDRWQFKHPKPADFFAVANEVSGQDLSWFFDQVHRSSEVFDNGIDTFKSIKDGDRYRTELIVQRIGGATFPVEIVVTFESGERRTERWDGKDRWRRYSYDTRSRAKTAQVDPDRVLLLDVNYINNSKTLEPKTADAARKWSLTWVVWLQDLMLTWALFA